MTSARQRRWTGWERALPSAVAVVLSLPCLTLGYFFWDDFAFLTRLQADPAAAFRYQPGSAFYRPLSQGLYFLLLLPLGLKGAIVAHIVNLALLVACVCILTSLVRSVAGSRAGILAGLLLAGFAPAAGLVAWASGSQDLLAMFFLLAALRLHHAGRTGWAVIAGAAGLLSKETIAVAWPVLILWDTLIGRRPARLRTPLLAYGGLVVTWALLHPGIRLFFERGFFVHERPGYLGFRNLAITMLNARRYLVTLFNLPATGWTTPWPWDRAPYGAGAALLAIAGAWFVTRTDGGARVSSEDAMTPRLSLWRAALIGALLAIPMLVLPSVIIQRWVSYYACLPALGMTIFLGVLLARTPAVVVCAALVTYLALGTWSRGVVDESGAMMTEQSFVAGSRAIRDVERGFRALRPTLPRGSEILVSVASSKMVSIYGMLLQGKAPRIWYGDPTLQVLTPETRFAGAPAEYLFRVTSARDVVEIQPDRIGYRSSRGEPLPEDELRAPIRTYARGLAASGETDRSVEILERLADGDPNPTRSYDLRLAAMARFASGKRAEADSLRLAAAPIPREYALDAIAKVKAEPTRSADLDSAAYWAFEISPQDPEAVRYWMAMFFGSEYYPQAADFARRLQTLLPGDQESADVLRRIEAQGATGRSRAGGSR